MAQTLAFGLVKRVGSKTEKLQLSVGEKSGAGHIDSHQPYPDTDIQRTLRTTLKPTIALLREKAVQACLDIEIVELLCDGAFDAVLAGDPATHDRILSDALRNDMTGVDVVILALSPWPGW